MNALYANLPPENRPDQIFPYSLIGVHGEFYELTNYLGGSVMFDQIPEVHYDHGGEYFHYYGEPPQVFGEFAHCHAQNPYGLQPFVQMSLNGLFLNAIANQWNSQPEYPATDHTTLGDAIMRSWNDPNFAVNAVVGTMADGETSYRTIMSGSECQEAGLIDQVQFIYMSST